MWRKVCAWIGCALLVCPAFAEDKQLRIRQRDFLFGDWGGARSALAERGLDFELLYTAETLWNVHGGLSTGSEYRADLSLTVSLDTERFGWWDNGEFFLHLQAQHGDGLSERRVGDFQVLSNIDEEDFAQVSEFWYRHTFADGKFWLKVGKQESNEDFAFVEYGGEFSNSSPGYSPTIPLVTFPDPDWGVVMGLEPVDWFSVNVGVYQGRPNGGQSIGNTIDNLYGPMLMIEPAFHYTLRGRPGHLRFGFWWNGDRFDKLEPEDAASGFDVAAQLSLLRDVRNRGFAPVFLEGLTRAAVGFFGDELLDRLKGKESKDETSGFYVTWDQLVYAEAADEDQGIGIFAQYGRADEDVIEAEQYYGAGMQWTGAFSGRDEDVLGLGVFHVNFSDKAGFDEAGETAIELYYRAQIKPWLSLKPDVQFIVQPGGQKGEAAWVLGFRTEWSF